MLHLPVSVGEALDKWSILAIKRRYITRRERLDHVRQEQEALEPLVAPYVKQCGRLYELLEQCNERIWFLVEQVRNGEIGPEDYRVLSENDARFRIKRKINTVASSAYHEQKSFHGEPLALKYDPPITPVSLVLLEELSVYYDGLHCYTTLLDPTAPPPSTLDPEIILHFTDTPPAWAITISSLDDLIQTLHKHRQAQRMES